MIGPGLMANREDHTADTQERINCFFALARPYSQQISSYNLSPMYVQDEGLAPAWFLLTGSFFSLELFAEGSRVQRNEPVKNRYPI